MQLEADLGADKPTPRCRGLTEGTLEEVKDSKQPVLKRSKKTVWNLNGFTDDDQAPETDETLN